MSQRNQYMWGLSDGIVWGIILSLAAGAIALICGLISIPGITL